MVYRSFRWLASSLHRKSSNKTLTEVAATLCSQTMPPATTSYHHNHFTITEHVWMDHSKMKNSLLIGGLPHFKWNKPSARPLNPKNSMQAEVFAKVFKSGTGKMLRLSKSAYPRISKAYLWNIIKNLKLLERKHLITRQPWEAACITSA